jgi:hypothetical protein
VLQREGDVRRIWPVSLAIELMTQSGTAKIAEMRSGLKDALAIRAAELRATEDPASARTLAWCSFPRRPRASLPGEASHDQLLECLQFPGSSMELSSTRPPRDSLRPVRPATWSTLRKGATRGSGLLRGTWSARNKGGEPQENRSRT